MVIATFRSSGVNCEHYTAVSIADSGQLGSQWNPIILSVTRRRKGTASIREVAIAYLPAAVCFSG
jgi:hypothetical protein